MDHCLGTSRLQCRPEAAGVRLVYCDAPYPAASAHTRKPSRIRTEAGNRGASGPEGKTKVKCFLQPLCFISLGYIIPEHWMDARIGQTSMHILFVADGLQTYMCMMYILA
jgi:hypothetical protein